jgi:protoporphyrinogen IX oxidase
MLWLKAFHIFSVVTWFAGLFYLPRLFIYHASAGDAVGIERFKVMEKKLFVMMTIGATLTAGFGIAMLVAAPGLLAFGWIHAKLALVALLLGYHFWCYRLLLAFRADANSRSTGWLRAFNEIPAVFLLAIVLLAVLKPF